MSKDFTIYYCKNKECHNQYFLNLHPNHEKKCLYCGKQLKIFVCQDTAIKNKKNKFFKKLKLLNKKQWRVKLWGE